MFSLLVCRVMGDKKWLRFARNANMPGTPWNGGYQKLNANHIAKKTRDLRSQITLQLVRKEDVSQLRVTVKELDYMLSKLVCLDELCGAAFGDLENHNTWLSDEVQTKVQEICRKLWKRFRLPVYYSFGTVMHKFCNSYSGSKRAVATTAKRTTHSKESCSPGTSSSSPGTSFSSPGTKTMDLTFSGKNLPPKSAPKRTSSGGSDKSITSPSSSSQPSSSRSSKPSSSSSKLSSSSSKSSSSSSGGGSCSSSDGRLAIGSSNSSKSQRRNSTPDFKSNSCAIGEAATKTTKQLVFARGVVISADPLRDYPDFHPEFDFPWVCVVLSAPIGSYGI